MTSYPVCMVCFCRFDTDLSLHSQQPSHRLPVCCSSCPASICYQCYTYVRDAQRVMVIQQQQSDNYMACPRCENSSAFSVPPSFTPAYCLLLKSQYENCSSLHLSPSSHTRRAAHEISAAYTCESKAATVSPVAFLIKNEQSSQDESKRLDADAHVVDSRYFDAKSCTSPIFPPNPALSGSNSSTVLTESRNTTITSVPTSLLPFGTAIKRDRSSTEAAATIHNAIVSSTTLPANITSAFVTRPNATSQGIPTSWTVRSHIETTASRMNVCMQFKKDHGAIHDQLCPDETRNPVGNLFHALIPTADMTPVKIEEAIHLKSTWMAPRKAYETRMQELLIHDTDSSEDTTMDCQDDYSQISTSTWSANSSCHGIVEEPHSVKIQSDDVKRINGGPIQARMDGKGLSQMASEEILFA
jgi:hypothetical protein